MKSSACRSYERYLALARAKALSGRRTTTSTPNIISDRSPRTEERDRRLRRGQPVDTTPVPGRDSGCPRGSGKKFKRCYGAPDRLHETGFDRRVDGILRAIGYQRFVLTHYCPRRRAGSEQGRINLGALEMTTSSGIKHVYDPDTLSIMTDAFDRACDFLPVQFRDSDHMRRKLASARVTRRASPSRPSSSFSDNPLGSRVSGCLLSRCA
jgi:hypothetical protein